VQIPVIARVRCGAELRPRSINDQAALFAAQEVVHDRNPCSRQSLRVPEEISDAHGLLAAFLTTTTTTTTVNGFAQGSHGAEASPVSL
jgi:hypothetical protein